MSLSAAVTARLLKEPILGLSRAKNTGLAVARGRLLIFTDDDVTPCPRWLSAYWAAYQERPIGYFFGGPIESEFDGQRPDPDLLRLAPCSVKGFDHGITAKLLGRHASFIGPNWACPVEIVRRVGGFDVRRGSNAIPGRVCAGEETHLMRQLRRRGWRGWYLPEARLTHFVPLSKSAPQHIAMRCEAGAFDRAIAFPWSRNPKFARGLFIVASFWAALWWVVWRLRGMSGADTYAYIRWRGAVGWVAGFAERLQSRHRDLD